VTSASSGSVPAPDGVTAGPVPADGVTAAPAPADGVTAAPVPAGYPARAFALLGTVQVTLVFTITLIAVPLPAIGREFGLGHSSLILVSTAYGLSFSGLLLLGGRLADRRGARVVLTVGLAIFVVGSSLAAAAPGFAVLVAARFAQGTGAALIAPAAMAVLRAIIPDEGEHARALASWGGLSVLGATAGILLSGVVTTWVSWRWMFILALLIGVVALVLTPRWLPPVAARGRAGLDLPGAVLATAGVTFLSYGLVVTGAHAWSSAAVVVPLVAGLALLIVFAAAELRSRDPLLPPAFLAGRSRVTALLAISFCAAGTAVMFLFLALYFQQARGWTPLRTSLAFVPYALSLITAGRAARPLVARFGARAVTGAGLAVAATGLLLLAQLSPHTAYTTGLLPGIVLLPTGAALTFAGAAVLTVGGVSPQQAGLAGGVMNTAMELGPTLGLALLTAVAAARASHVAAAGASPQTATTSGYARALGAAGLAFALLALLTLIPIRPALPHRRSSDSQE
jgi:MFS family permease